MEFEPQICAGFRLSPLKIEAYKPIEEIQPRVLGIYGYAERCDKDRFLRAYVSIITESRFGTI